MCILLGPRVPLSHWFTSTIPSILLQQLFLLQDIFLPFPSPFFSFSPDQIFPFSKCFHSSNAFLYFNSPFSLPSLTKYFPSPFFFSFVDQILSFYLSSSWNILHEAPIAPQKLKKKKTNLLRNFIRMIFLFYITILTCVDATSHSLKEKSYKCSSGRQSYRLMPVSAVG